MRQAKGTHRAANVSTSVSLASRLPITYVRVLIGVVGSAALDSPTGATVVCAFGFTLLAFAVTAWLWGWRPASPAGVVDHVMAPATDRE